MCVRGYQSVRVCHAHARARAPPTSLAVQLSVIYAKASRGLSCKRVTHAHVYLYVQAAYVAHNTICTICRGFIHTCMRAREHAHDGDGVIRGEHARRGVLCGARPAARNGRC